MNDNGKDTAKARRLNEAFRHLYANFGITSQTEFADALNVQRTGLSAAMNGSKAYLTKNLFMKLCAAFPGVFNLDYLLTGEGELLASSEQQPTPPTAPDYQRELIESLKSRIEDKDREIAYLRSVIDRLHHRLGVSQQWDTTRASFMVSDELQPPAPDK